MDAAEANAFLGHAMEVLALAVMGWNLKTQLKVSELVAVLQAKHEGHAEDLKEMKAQLRDLERRPSCS